MGECLYKRFICLKNFNEFFMYLFRWRKVGGGVALMHVYVWEHIVSLSYITAWWIFMKLGRDEVLMVPYKCCCFFGQTRPGADPGQGKNRSGGPLLQWTSSSDLKATATNRIHSNDLEACGMKCCYFLFHSEVKFLTRFWRLFGLSHFALF